MKTLALLLLFCGTLHAQDTTQCPLRYMFQYYPPAQHYMELSVKNDSATAYLIAYSEADGFSSDISPSVGWSVGDADSFGVYMRTDSAVLVTIQHDGPYGSFIEDTMIVGPFYWHRVAVRVTPGQHNYSVELYPGSQHGPPRTTVFDVPVYIGGAYEWSDAPASVTGVEQRKPVRHEWFDLLGRPADSTAMGFVISSDGTRKMNF
jgi:hypothetical protein